MAFWQLVGEAGRPLDDTIRDADEIGVSNATLNLRSLAVDDLRFNQVFDTAADATANDIEEGQIVDLHRDGARIFRGHCTRRRARDTVRGGLQVDTTVSGVWWWMEQTPLSGEINDQTGGEKERISFAFNTGDLRDHIIALLNRAITLGVPIAVGDIADCFDIPQITINQLSCADAMVELMRWVPDSTVWIDYAPDVPTFNMIRRPTANITTFTVGQQPCESIDVNRVFELETDQVVVTYVRRAVDGRTVFSEQISGHEGTATGGAGNRINLPADASDADDAYNGLDVEIVAGTGAGQTRTISLYTGGNRRATVTPNWATNPDASSVYVLGNGNPGDGRRQIVTVSGPELDSFLPNDLFDQYESSAIDLGTSSLNTFVSQLPAFAAAVEAGMGINSLVVPINTITHTWAQFTSDLPGSGGSIYQVPGSSFSELATGNNVDITNFSVLVGETPPEWLREQLGLIEVTMSGRWTFEHLRARVSGFGQPDTFAEPDWFFSLPANNLVYSGFEGVGNFNNIFNRLYEGSWETTAWVAPSIPTGTIFRDADYDFIQPPEGLAAALQETQNFSPFSGEIGIAEEEALPTGYLGSVVNVNGSLPAHAGMKALVQGVSVDISEGISALALGVPERLNYAGLVNRFRRTATDNIFYI